MWILHLLLTPDTYNNPKTSYKRLDIKFKTSLKLPKSFILHATFPKTVEIDQARNVTLQKTEKMGSFEVNMKTKQLQNALASNFPTKHSFDGIYSSDTLKDIRERPELITCNTGTSHKPSQS